jgi:hypothetical protein
MPLRGVLSHHDVVLNPLRAKSLRHRVGRVFLPRVIDIAAQNHQRFAAGYVDIRMRQAIDTV